MKKSISLILCAVLLCCTTLASLTVSAARNVTQGGGKITYKAEDFDTLKKDAEKVVADTGAWYWKDQGCLGINKGASVTFKFDLPDDATNAKVQSIGTCIADMSRTATFYISKDNTSFDKLGGSDGILSPWCNVDVSEYLTDNADNILYVKLAGETKDDFDCIMSFLQVCYSGDAAKTVEHPRLDTGLDTYKSVSKYLFTAAKDNSTVISSSLFNDNRVLKDWQDLEMVDAQKLYLTDWGYSFAAVGPIAPWASETAVLWGESQEPVKMHPQYSTGGCSFSFEVPVTSAMKIASVTLRMKGEYEILTSVDGQTWTSRTLNTKGTLSGDVNVDITDMLDGTDKTIYVRLATLDIMQGQAQAEQCVLRAVKLNWEEGRVLAEGEEPTPTKPTESETTTTTPDNSTTESETTTTDDSKTETSNTTAPDNSQAGSDGSNTNQTGSANDASEDSKAENPATGVSAGMSLSIALLATISVGVVVINRRKK